MRYHYRSPDIVITVDGEPIVLESPIYRKGTLFKDGDRGIVVVQQHFDADTKSCYWGEVDPDIANSIYTSPRFLVFFKEHAKVNYEIFELRKLMWLLRLRPLKREFWEDFF